METVFNQFYSYNIIIKNAFISQNYTKEKNKNKRLAIYAEEKDIKNSNVYSDAKSLLARQMRYLQKS